MLEFYQGKRIFVTGHTGFKGTWLCTWLQMLGAKLFGYSYSIPTQTSMYEKLKIGSLMEADFRGDIADFSLLKQAMQQCNPEIVIHLAAQPIVIHSYEDPLNTYRTNIVGTANLLECVKTLDSVRSVLIITTDKCYKNKNWIWGYRESDELGGDDPYSCSKACTELIVDSYVKSFFRNTKCKLATARAGNVIGGGDWADYRIVPDIVRACASGIPIKLRHPNYIRPWQHVMEPLFGYLLLCQKLFDNDEYSGAWNFGPNPEQQTTVRNVAQKVCLQLGGHISDMPSNELQCFHEAEKLNLDSTKAHNLLNWKSRLTLEETLDLTIDWYKKDNNKQNMLQVTKQELLQYMENVFLDTSDH